MINPLFGSIQRPSKSEDAKAALNFIELYRNADVDANGISFSKARSGNIAANASVTFLEEFNIKGSEEARFAPYERISIYNADAGVSCVVQFNGHGTLFAVPPETILHPPINPSIDYVKITLTNPGSDTITYKVVTTVYRPPVTEDRLIQRNVRYP